MLLQAQLSCGGTVLTSTRYKVQHSRAQNSRATTPTRAYISQELFSHTCSPAFKTTEVFIIRNTKRQNLIFIKKKMLQANQKFRYQQLQHHICYAIDILTMLFILKLLIFPVLFQRLGVAAGGSARSTPQRQLPHH